MVIVITGISCWQVAIVGIVKVCIRISLRDRFSISTSLSKVVCVSISVWVSMGIVVTSVTYWPGTIGVVVNESISISLGDGFSISTSLSEVVSVSICVWVS